MKRGFFLVICMISLFSVAYAKNYKFFGTVRDGSTNEPLVYANIFIEETKQGVTTDEQGKFSFILPQGEYTIQCSYVGYKTFIDTVSVNNDTYVSIKVNSIDLLLQNVTVYANKQNDESNQNEVSALSLQSQTIEKSTCLISDVLRSVQMLPGVTADNELNAKFNVRGGNSDENLVLINGTQVYEPYHVKEASNASIGIFDVDMIKKMDLITGGFSARYGDRMSSVVDIEYREGDREHYKGQVSLSLTDFDALAEGPLGDKGSFIFGARQSYTQYILNMIDASSRIHPEFYDLQGVISYSIMPQHKLSFKFIHAGDTFNEDPASSYNGPYSYPYATWGQQIGYYVTGSHDSSESHANYYSTMLALQSTDIISSNALIKSEFSYYDQREASHEWEISNYNNDFKNSNVNYFRNDTSLYLDDNNLHIQTLELNSSLDLQESSVFSTKTGVSYQRIFYDQQRLNGLTISEFNNEDNYPDTVNTSMTQNALDYNFGSIHAQSFKIAGYHENIIQIGEKLIFNIGGRFDYFDLNKELTWSPRINFAYSITPEITLRGAWGHYYQSPIYQQLAYSTATDTNTKSQRAIHYILGAEYNLISNALTHNFLKVKVEGYYKTYDNLISSTTSSYGDIYYSRKNDAVGRASGADFYIMYSNLNISGWISYSLLKAEQKLINDPNEGYFPRNTDQHHTFAALLNLNAGNNWDLSTRLAYGSGFAYTPQIAVFNTLTRQWSWIIGAPNSDHLPAYKRVDLRVDKNFQFFGLSASAFLDISNLFDFDNVQSYRYEINNQGQPYTEEIKLWPILPTLGITVRF